MQPCECLNDNFLCHAAEGCICKHGFTGDKCDESNILQRLQNPDDANSSYGVVLGVVMVFIIFGAVVVLLIFYYKRRVSNLKTEIAHVQYIADPSGFPPDRNHFDNPSYTYPTILKRDNETLLNNSNRIVNNLKSSNADRARLGIACCSTDDEEYPIKNGYTFEEFNRLKNKDADATNPNIYHSIDKQLDHVYDEIQQKDIELEYDHLDYTRPVNTIKPHYQKMSSPFGSRDLVKSDKSDVDE